jgi:hypothetical protein
MLVHRRTLTPRRRSARWRWGLWVALLALLLRAAVPMLAVGAAHARDVAVGSVCTVYGTVLPTAATDEAARHGTGTDGANTGDHCALAALAELAAGAGPAGPAVAALHRHCAPAAPPRSGIGAWADAAAAWVAQRKQGPPALA